MVLFPQNNHRIRIIKHKSPNIGEYLNFHTMFERFLCSVVGVFDIRVRFFNTTFNNISVTLWQSALLVGESGLPEESHRPLAKSLFLI
jgi:hypothetical protein